MLKIDNTLLEEVGLATLPASEKNSFLKHIYETLEMRVGIRLADQMTNQQLDEFEKYFEAKDDAGAFKWLETNFPNYKEIVQQEFDKLKGEVAQSAPQILAASQDKAAQSAAAQGAVPPVSGQGFAAPGQPGAAAPQPQVPPAGPTTPVAPAPAGSQPSQSPPAPASPAPSTMPPTAPQSQPSYAPPAPQSAPAPLPSASPSQSPYPSAPPSGQPPQQPQLEPQPESQPQPQSPTVPPYPSQQPPPGPGQ